MRAHAFNLEIQRVVKTFPRVGHTERKSQLLRAADSVSSNIVEGCAAATRKEFARYLDISIKSSSEVEYRLLLARDEGILHFATWQRLTAEIVEIRRMLFAFCRTVLATDRIEEEARKSRRRRLGETGGEQPRPEPDS